MPMPTPEQLEWFIKTGSFHGLGWLLVAFIVLVVCWVLVFGAKHVLGILSDVRKWIPKVVLAHLGFVEKTQEHGERTVVALETLTETTVVSHGNHTRTHAALGGLIEAAKEAAAHHNMPAVVRLLDDAQEELDKP